MKLKFLSIQYFIFALSVFALIYSIYTLIQVNRSYNEILRNYEARQSEVRTKNEELSQKVHNLLLRLSGDIYRNDCNRLVGEITEFTSESTGPNSSTYFLFRGDRLIGKMRIDRSYDTNGRYLSSSITCLK